MRVVTTRYSGFCPGVVQAERKIFRARKSHGADSIYVLGYLIHNQTYIDHLAEQSVRTVKESSEVPAGGVLVLRTHGIQRQTEERLRGDYEVLDLTCPKVKKIQLIIEDFADRGYFVLITGKGNHPEVQGLVSYARESAVVEKKEDLPSFLEKMKCGKMGKIFIVSQTTGEPELFHEAVRRVGELAASLDIPMEAHDSICSITSLREREAVKIQRDVDVTFVIGDRMSSNATKLYKILAAGSANTFFVNGRKELESLGLDYTSWKTAQVVSSSSTPDFLEKEIVSFLESM